MKKSNLLSITSIFALVFSGLLNACGCKKDIDPSKAYEYLSNAHANLKDYYEGDFNVVSTYKYDIEHSIVPLSNGNSDNETKQYNVVITGNEDEKKYGKYAFDSEKIFESKYNIGDEVISVDDEEFVVKNIETNAYEMFINSLYQEDSSNDINGYIKNEATRALNERFDNMHIEFDGDFDNLSVNSYLKNEVFTVNYTYSHSINIGNDETELIAVGKLQFDDEDMLYASIDLDFVLNGTTHEYTVTHQYKDDYVDPTEEGNVLSGLQSMLDIDFDYYQKLIDYEKSFALLLYHESCIHCKNFVKSFNYSKSVIYKLELDGLSERNVVTLYELFDEAFCNEVPTNDDSYSIATPAVIRFEKGIISCISYGNVDTTNQYNYDLLTSIIEGTFSGDTIIYQ